jgi:hypothetical protein
MGWKIEIYSWPALLSDCYKRMAEVHRDWVTIYDLTLWAVKAWDKGETVREHTLGRRGMRLLMPILMLMPMPMRAGGLIKIAEEEEEKETPIQTRWRRLVIGLESPRGRRRRRESEMKWM